MVMCLLLSVSCSKSKNDIDAETARHLKTAQMYADQGQIKAAIFEVKKATYNWRKYLIPLVPTVLRKPY